MPEQVIIEFISDTSQLSPSTDILEQQGKITRQNADDFKKTNVELVKAQKALQGIGSISKQINDTGQITKKNLADIANIVKSQSATFQKEFKNGVIDGLKEAGVSAEQFEEALTKATGESSTLKTELRELVEVLSEMKIKGEDNTEQYKQLAEKAAEVKKAIANTNQEVKNFASDTSNIDGVISLAGGIAGGFAAAQGAAALFGDESEELQKTLLRVNAAMAILQGIQQIQVVLQKESAAATLANTIAQSTYNFVVGTSIGLMKAFRIALAATGVGVFILLVYELVTALQSSNDETERTNDLLDKEKDRLEGLNELISERIALQEAQARNAGALESELIKIQGRGINAQIDGLNQSNEKLREQQEEVGRTSKNWFKLNEQIQANNDTIDKLNNDALIKQQELLRQITEESLKDIAAGFAAQLAGSKKNSKDQLELSKLLANAEKDVALNAEGLTGNEKLKIIAENNKKIRDLNREFQVVLQNDRIAAIEASLSKEQTRSRALGERIGQTEIDLQKKLVQEKADLELLQEGLTANQILEIKTKSINDQVKLQRDFNKQTRKEALEDMISRNNAELSLLQISDAKKLSLTIENIMTAAQAEVDANLGNDAKIKEINAKRDKDIRDAKIASIQAIAEYEIQVTQAKTGVLSRGIQNQLDAEEKIKSASTEFEKKRVEKETGFKRISINEELRLIDILTAYQSGSIAKRIDALNDERAQGLISQKDYNLQYEVLVDEQAKIIEDGEKKKREAINKTTEEARDKNIKLINDLVAVASQVIDVIDNLFQSQASRENDQLNARKQQLKDLQDAGAITEKEATIRQKRIEADEKRLRQQQAQREKQIAVFKALLAIPQAYLQGLSTGGPILAAIYGALAAANAAIIIARPIPKFGKGKKDNYEGPGEVGETGAELIEHNGRMYVADKPQVVWLGKTDKVYNPSETKRMLEKPSMSSERTPLSIKEKPFEIDYKKLGQEVGKNIPQTGINIDKNGFNEWVRKGQLFTNWLNNRRSW